MSRCSRSSSPSATAASLCARPTSLVAGRRRLIPLASADELPPVVFDGRKVTIDRTDIVFPPTLFDVVTVVPVEATNVAELQAARSILDAMVSALFLVYPTLVIGYAAPGPDGTPEIVLVVPRKDVVPIGSPPLPTTIDEIPVRLLESGLCKAFAHGSKTGRVAPGSAFGPLGGRTSTLGAVVRRAEGGEACIVTALHAALLEPEEGAKGEPGCASSGNLTVDIIGREMHVHEPEPPGSVKLIGTVGMFDGIHDVARIDSVVDDEACLMAVPHTAACDGRRPRHVRKWGETARACRRRRWHIYGCHVRAPHEGWGEHRVHSRCAALHRRVVPTDRHSCGGGSTSGRYTGQQCVPANP
eukprot:m.68490 g.68490  ORF g.68490 m.68490 type:complete len:357 (+) comp18317_c0_seq2:575-1645(+)